MTRAEDWCFVPCLHLPGFLFSLEFPRLLALGVRLSAPDLATCGSSGCQPVGNRFGSGRELGLDCIDRAQEEVGRGKEGKGMSGVNGRHKSIGIEDEDEGIAEGED
ncbi:unnamed protein product [Calypogeia fissa]